MQGLTGLEPKKSWARVKSTDGGFALQGGVFKKATKMLESRCLMGKRVRSDAEGGSSCTVGRWIASQPTNEGRRATRWGGDGREEEALNPLT